jgi:hypothetical protein
MMDAIRTTVAVVNFCQTTWHNNPEDSHLQKCVFQGMFQLTAIGLVKLNPPHILGKFVLLT